MQRSCLKTYISYRFDADDANDTDLRKNNPCHPRHRASENNQPIILFPLNGRIGLRRHVITNTVYILHLLENTVGNLHQYRPLYRLNSSSHGIHRINGTDNDRPVKRTGIITYTYRLEIGYNSEILPYFLIQTANRNSSCKIASDSRTASKRSRVIAPRQRTPNPGPGKG